MTAVKPLLSSITLSVLPSMLALATFTVTLTLVRPRVGVLPILLLATVINLLCARRVPMTWSPRLGVIWVQMSIRGIPLRSLLRSRCLSLRLARTVLLESVTFRLLVTVPVARGRLLATTTG